MKNSPIEIFKHGIAKPLLYEVPTYLRQNPIETINKKTKRKKR